MPQKGSSGFLVGDFHSRSDGFLAISREMSLSIEGEICHVFAMAKSKLLHDLYRFPDFVPLPGIRGVFGDPLAVVIDLLRPRKKRSSAASAARCIAATTTSGDVAYAISPAGTDASISSFSCVESSARGAAA